ncbi:hypothetical protein BGX26_003974 [Mortierella sp. AD094]|nr:hypothetical protein BGX26_003974 [Mortierella sp. AD094]
MGPQLDDADRVFLDLLCPRATRKDAKVRIANGNADDDDEDDNADLGSTSANKRNYQQSFLLSFLVHLYSGNYPRAKGIGQRVNDFIDRLIHLGIYTPPRTRSELNEKTPFTPSDLLESITSQLRVELKNIYKNGSCDLHQQLKEMKKKGLLGPNIDVVVHQATTIDVEIQEDRSTIENYLTLNRLSRNPRRIVPMTSSKQPFVAFSERVLAGFFYAHEGDLRTSIQELVKGRSIKEPGFLIKQFLADIDHKNLTVRQRGKLRHRAAIELPTFGDLENHLRMLEHEDFRPDTYIRKGHFPRGTIRSDGFTLQLLCFKTKELLLVKYKRLPDDRLPPRLTSTVHGTNDFLTEIRNVLRTKEDVARLWPDIDPRYIKTLTLDAGQAFVVGAYAHLSQKAGNNDQSPSFKGSFAHASTSASTTPHMMQAPTLEQQSISTLPTKTNINDTPHHNLAVNQKAVTQPVFRYRRWLEHEKQLIPEGQLESIADIESRLPPLQGPEASVTNYIEKPEQVEDRLSDFYNGNNNRFKKHTWDMKRAKHIEYQAIANSLLKIVGGSIGERRKEGNPVLIGVGLGHFGSSSRLSSLHSSFLSYFVPLARSLGYIVVGLNEYYTSKKCPDCQQFVAQVTLREFFCPHCGRYRHRDVMAAENMSNIAREYLLHQ